MKLASLILAALTAVLVSFVLSFAFRPSCVEATGLLLTPIVPLAFGVVILINGHGGRAVIATAAALVVALSLHIGTVELVLKQEAQCKPHVIVPTAVATTDTIPADTVTVGCIETSMVVLFEYDSDNVSVQTLQAIDSFVRANPNATFIVEGHACHIGTADYNMSLSARRATAVHTITGGQMLFHGENHPSTDEVSSRRVVIRAVCTPAPVSAPVSTPVTQAPTETIAVTRPTVDTTIFPFVGGIVIDTTGVGDTTDTTRDTIMVSPWVAVDSMYLPNKVQVNVQQFTCDCTWLTKLSTDSLYLAYRALNRKARATNASYCTQTCRHAAAALHAARTDRQVAKKPTVKARKKRTRKIGRGTVRKGNVITRTLDRWFPYRNC